MFESGLMLSDDFARWRTLVGIDEVAWKEAAEAMAMVAAVAWTQLDNAGAVDPSVFSLQAKIS